ncbi:putative ribonuclease H-like domain-containing protein [Tanacetum coccineum]
MKPNAPFGVTLNPTHPGLLETEPNANQHTLRWAEVEVVLWWDGDVETNLRWRAAVVSALPSQAIRSFSQKETCLNLSRRLHSTTIDFINSELRKSEAKASEAKPKAVRKNNGAPIIEDWVSESEEEDVPQAKIEKKTVKPSFAKIEFVKPKGKTARKTAKQVDCKKVNQKQFQNTKPVWNNAKRVNHQNFAKKTHPCPKKNMVPRARVNTVKDINVARPKAVVNAARPKAVVNVVKGNNVNVVKASACWVWKPKTKVLDHVSKHNSASITLKKFDYVNDKARSKLVMVWGPQKENDFLKLNVPGQSNKGFTDHCVIDSGCSRHMTGNMSYLIDYEEIDGGYVAFGGNPKGGKITRKGTKACDDAGLKLECKDSTLANDEKMVLLKEQEKKVGDSCKPQNEVIAVSGKSSIELPDDLNMPELEDIVYSDNDEDSTQRYPVEQIIEDLYSAPQTRKKDKEFGRIVEPRRIKEEVYVCQPPRFEDLDFPDRVYKVEKALYGLHQAPRAWYETLSTYLLDNGFQRGKIGKTLFIRRDKGDILLVQVYVDDIIFGFTKKSLCTEFKKMMHKKFQMSSMGELTFFLGL